MVDMKVDVVVHPVSDVDSANRFYLNMGWRTRRRFCQRCQRSKDHQRVRHVVAIFAAWHSIEWKNTASS
jgi:hypothetical protein